MFVYFRLILKKRYLGVMVALATLMPLTGFTQVGNKVCQVTVYDAYNKPLQLPSLGKKHLLIFYVDPDHPSQNKDFRNYFKKHPFTDDNIDSYGIVNLKDAPLLANSLLRFMIRKEIAGTQAYVYNDPDNSLSRAWKLGNVNNKFVVLWINKDCVIEFFKAGQLNEEEIVQVHALIKKYKASVMPETPAPAADTVPSLEKISTEYVSSSVKE